MDIIEWMEMWLKEDLESGKGAMLETFIEIGKEQENK